MSSSEDFPPLPSRSKSPYLWLAEGTGLLLAGSYIGLFRSPGELFMGDVQRIMYVHVPTAWIAMLALTFSFVCALAYLFTSRWIWDARLEAAIEVGVVLAALLCVQGSIWAKPTWGVWWDWDPRLTTTAVMVLAYLGILALRRSVDDPARRARWSAVTAIIAAANVPVVYFSVQWWNSLHQMQSDPSGVSSIFHMPLRLNAFGMLFIMVGLLMLRTRTSLFSTRAELAPPEEL